MPRQLGCRVGLLTAATLFWLSLPINAFAQAAPNAYQIGVPEHGDFSGSDFENVQLNNNNLHIEIPLWNLSGRGPSIGFKYVYDSRGWGFNEHCGQKTGTCTDTVTPTPGIHGLGPTSNHLVLALVGPQTYHIKTTTGSYTCNGTGLVVVTYSYSIGTPDGTSHHFAPDPVESSNETGFCFPHPTTLYADDGSGWMLNVDQNGVVVKAVAKDGTVVTTSTGSTAEDANGNDIVTTFGTSYGNDTLGRQFNLDGSYYDSSGVLRASSVGGQNVAIQTHLCHLSSADFCNEYSATWLLPTTITLPNGQTYTFAYDQGSPTHPYYGQPLSVTLPTGGQIAWGWSGEDISGPILVSRQLSGDPQPWQYSGTTVTDPAGNDMVYTCGWYDPPYALLGGDPVCYIITKKYYQGSQTSGTLLKTVQTDYWTTGEPAILPTRETTTWNQQNLVSKVEMDYDSWVASTFNTSTFYATAGNVVEKREFDYGTGASGSQVRTTQNGYLHLSNSTYRGLNIADKVTSKKIYAGSSGSGTLVAQTLNTYDGVAIPAAGNTSGSPAPNHDYTNYPASFNYRGNLTQISKGLKSGSTWTWLNTNNTYNDLGEILTSTDPAGNKTTYDYTDSWATITNPQCVTSAHSYGFPTTITDPLNHQTKHTCYSCTSLTGSTQDANDIAASRAGTTFSYDLMSRLTATNYPDGGQTTVAYNDAIPYTATTTQLIKSSPTTLNKVRAVVHDGLGRVQQTHLTDPDCTSGPVMVDYTYRYDSSPPTGIPAGRFTTVSNPYCTTSDATYGITKTRYDALDRPVLVVPPDGSDTANNVATVYAGNVTTVTDQAGAARKSTTDGLGRLTFVYEDPATLNYETDYTYDVLDDLTGVTQKGGSTSGSWRTRTFLYDSLARLTQATNPESGTIGYTYDADSNLFQKTSPQPNQQSTATTTITYCYDAGNRLASKTYSAQSCPVTTPMVSFLYDQASYNGLTITNGIGRRTGMSDGSGTTAWSFDPMGRVAAEKRTIAGVTKQMSYQYYLDGELGNLFYPNGIRMDYGVTAASRMFGVIDSANNYVFNNTTYAPQGAVATMHQGSYGAFGGMGTTFTYNKRLQPYTIKTILPNLTVVRDLAYNFNLGTADNGNVSSITNNKTPGRSQTFTYDKLNRITTAATQGTTGATCWGQKFGYINSSGSFVLGPDPWGNLTQIQSTQCSSPTFNQGITTKNQFAAPMSYDSAGNLINDGGGRAYTYDSENRLATAGGVTYTYDGDGKRVKKSNGTLYWTGTGWDPLLETDLAGNATEEYVFFNGERVARVDLPANTVEYYFSDHLNSTDIVTNATGGIVRESDYVPYGGEIVISGTDPNRYKFTGKERDPESGLDDFDARFYSSPFGRFMTPDWAATATAVPYANFGNPQSLNLYSYVQNNPTTMGDPDGHGALDFIAQTVGGIVNTVNQNNGFNSPQPLPENSLGRAIGNTITGIQGTAEVLGGATLTAGGGAEALGTSPLALTGAGAPIPLAGIGVAVAGVGIAGHGTLVLGNTLKSISQGPKAADAPGVTAGGQATDEHGNKLGPSGDKQIDKTRSNTREGANNRALNEGSRSVEHANPSEGKQHFHPADRNGEKKPSSTHHEYHKKHKN